MQQICTNVCVLPGTSYHLFYMCAPEKKAHGSHDPGQLILTRGGLLSFFFFFSDQHQLGPALGGGPGPLARLSPGDLPQVERHLDGRPGAACLMM